MIVCRTVLPINLSAIAQDGFQQGDFVFDQIEPILTKLADLIYAIISWDNKGTIQFLALIASNLND